MSKFEHHVNQLTSSSTITKDEAKQLHEQYVSLDESKRQWLENNFNSYTNSFYDLRGFLDENSTNPVNKVNNSTYLNLIEDYYILKIVSLKSKQSLINAYNSGDENLKDKLDKYPQVFLDDYLSKVKKDSSFYKSLSSIQANIQFLTWLTIISIVVYIIALLMS